MPKTCDVITEWPLHAVPGHSRSPIFVQMESPCATYYQWIVVINQPRPITSFKLLDLTDVVFSSYME